MARLQTVAPEQATGEVAELFDSIRKKLGTVPNIFQGMANSPTTLRAYLTLDTLIEQGTLSPIEQDMVRLVVSQYNGCKYCLAAHTTTAGMKGLSEDQTLDIRKGNPKGPRQEALVRFVLHVLDSKGCVKDGDLKEFRDAGFTDAQVSEVITIIAQKILSNYFNHVHETVLDFEPAPSL